MQSNDIRNRQLPHYVRRAILDRDRHACRLCGGGNHLHVHHVDGRGARSKDPNHDPANLVTLCRPCHRQVHTAKVMLTPALFERAGRIRSGEEPPPRALGTWLLRYDRSNWPEKAYFAEHEDQDCPQDCENCRAAQII